MNANEFVRQLRELAPQKPLLLKCGYGDDEADEFIESFACQSRSKALGIETNGDSVLELLNEWEVSHVEIGPISFHSRPVHLENHLEIGTVEGDRLAYRPSKRDYVLLDCQDLNHVMCEVAPNGDSLLDGLLVVAGYYAKTAAEEIDIDDSNVGAEFRTRCAEALGGKKYDSFCASILGV